MIGLAESQKTKETPNMINRTEEDMKKLKNFYISDEYIAKNPSLHEEDSPWKVSKIIPLIDVFLGYSNKNEINLLDVGGGCWINSQCNLCLH